MFEKYNPKILKMQEDGPKDEYVVVDDVDEPQSDGFVAKIESFLDSRYFVVSMLVLVAVASFLLGRVSTLGQSKVPVRVIQEGVISEKVSDSGLESVKKIDQAAAVGTSADLSTPASSEEVVASKNGTKYHYPWCAGAKQIAEKNLVKFGSIAEARSKGYTPASNCKGLK